MNFTPSSATTESLAAAAAVVRSVVMCLSLSAKLGVQAGTHNHSCPIALPGLGLAPSSMVE
jgi:hypothetical protein